MRSPVAEFKFSLHGFLVESRQACLSLSFSICKMGLITPTFLESSNYLLCMGSTS